ncbi:MAG: ABC transporter substrate-binding protein [Micavibrio sp.]|nr:ABC transporter substrate-binding protein [Micavibrio sp.]
MKHMNQIKVGILAVAVILSSALPLAFAHAQGDEDGKKITILRPGLPPHAFFDPFEKAMKAAAKDLGEDLEVLYADDHYVMIDRVSEISKRDEKPDAVVYLSMRQNGPKALDAFEKLGIKSFIVNAGLTEKQYQEVGSPREKMPHWIGEMLPDDVGAGYALGEALYNQAIAADPSLKDSKVKLLVIEANAGDGASVLRTRGLKEYLETNPAIETIQFVKAQWDQGRAKNLTAHMFKRYDDIDVIWAASDAMAIGAAEAAKEQGKIPGEDIFIGGVDWSESGLKAIKEGTLTASAGGHVLEGAWAAVLLHDYFNGKDFADIGDVKLKSPMYIAAKDNVEEIESISANIEEIDFKQFSRAHNPELTEYNFNILEMKK